MISPAVEEIIYPAVQHKAQEHGARLLKIGGMPDHIHIVAAVPPTIALADFVRELKTASSRAVNKATILDGRFNWQEGYGAFTLNPFDLTAVLEYVANQKQHHAANKLWPSFERLQDDR